MQLPAAILVRDSGIYFPQGEPVRVALPSVNGKAPEHWRTITATEALALAQAGAISGVGRRNALRYALLIVPADEADLAIDRQRREIAIRGRLQPSMASKTIDRQRIATRTGATFTVYQHCRNAFFRGMMPMVNA